MEVDTILRIHSIDRLPTVPFADIHHKLANTNFEDAVNILPVVKIFTGSRELTGLFL